MIDENLTLQKFGYKSTDLSFKSNKIVVAICTQCGKDREIRKTDYRLLCKNCSRHFKSGFKQPFEWVRKMSLRNHTEEAKRSISLKNLGRKHSETTRLKLRGPNSPHWKGGISHLRDLIYQTPEYKNWRTAIFIRDKGICQECKIAKSEEVHHLKRFSLIYQEFLKEYDQFSPIEDKETLLRLATKYKPFWDLENGIAICSECHSKTKGRSKIV